jgi:hypothetical protein
MSLVILSSESENKVDVGTALETVPPEESVSVV